MSSNKGKAMTKIGLWKCDICHTEYRSDRKTGNLYQDYNSNETVYIQLPGCDGISNSYPKTFNFQDTCYKCRAELREAIEKVIDSKLCSHEE